jgi:hypothetical protein
MAVTDIEGNPIEGAQEASGLNPQRGMTPEKHWYDFITGGDRQDIVAALLDASAAGKQSTFRGYGFYDALAEAQRTGRGIAGQQQALADILRARAEGRGGPSLAELQLQQTLEQNRAAQAGALAAAGRGMNPALAQRLLLQQGATLGQQAAGQGAILRAQEQLAAQAALGQQLGQMRGAEGQLFGQAGQLGLGQEKLSVETQEAQRARELEVALANQRAEQERQRLQQNQEESQVQSAQENRAAIGEVAKTGGKIAGTAIGGPVGGAIASGLAQGGPVGKAIAIRAKKMSEGDLNKLDNEKNDVVPAMLSEGEAVIPRSIMMSPNPPAAAAKFIEALLANRDKKDAKKEALKVALGKKK